jgi:TonB family protein
MSAAKKRTSMSVWLRSSRWRRWLPAAAISVTLHVALAPAIVDYVSGRLGSGGPPPTPISAQLELEEKLLRKSAEPEKPILEPPEEVPLVEPNLPAFPDAPSIRLPQLNQRPQLAKNDIHFPESAFGEHLVHTSTPTRLDGPAGHSPGNREVLPEATQPATDRTPLAPIFPAEPPGTFLDGLPSAAVRLGETRTIFGGQSEEELRRRVYAGTYYPEAAADLELEGVVIVGFRVDGDGQPTDLSVTNEEMCHPILQEEALSMVRSGAPYPVPGTRREIEVTVAVAYLNTPHGQGERVQMLLSSGVEAVDQHARQMAAQDALQNDQLGWHLALYRVGAKVTVKPGRHLHSPRLDSFDGDSRLKRVFVESLPHLIPRGESSARLKIPIQFRILDP